MKIGSLSCHEIRKAEQAFLKYIPSICFKKKFCRVNKPIQYIYEIVQLNYNRI